ncbi:hypothetical protein [Novosphingobium sp. KN65.2]|uniref:hypothetical protein n=1 Tax=Novosphingobium sp. KN65.2 TaxID=1478134 RepID=UPI0005DFF0BE|nr:hypothetical protein [Novosphingobium sp. KN65.2]CDO37148.1 conserved hypothetical protein [Novosphingobium sp. KN65.2]
MFDITQKRAAATGEIELKDGDGSPLFNDDGEALSVTVYSPASKQWEQANAEINRKRAERMRKNGGKVEAALDGAKAEQIDFLCRVTIRLNNFEYPVDAGGDQVRALYEDDALGYIRDHVYSEVHDWSAFTRGSVKN